MCIMGLSEGPHEDDGTRAPSAPPPSDRRRFSFRGFVRGRGRGRERLPPFVRGGVATAAATTAVVATAPHVTAPLAAAATTETILRD